MTILKVQCDECGAIMSDETKYYLTIKYSHGSRTINNISVTCWECPEKRGEKGEI